MKLDVLGRLLASPYSRTHLWAHDPVLGMEVGEERWILHSRGIWDHAGQPVDAWLGAGPEDVVAMLERRVPAGVVHYRLGDRDIAARRKQAHAILALAALGWAGPWPDAAADPEHGRLLLESLLALEIGPDDGRGQLFPPGAPVQVDLRVTDGVRHRSVVTVGLAGPCELVVELPPRAPVERALRPLRAAALWVAENGLPARTLDLGPLRLEFDDHPRFRRGLPLAHGSARMLRISTRSSPAP